MKLHTIGSKLLATTLLILPPLTRALAGQLFPEDPQPRVEATGGTEGTV